MRKRRRKGGHDEEYAEKGGIEVVFTNLMCWAPHMMKMSHYFLVFGTLWNLGLF